MIESGKWIAAALRRPEAQSLRRRIMHQLAVRREIERSASGFIALVAIPAGFAALGAYSERLAKAIGNLGLAIFWCVAVFVLGFFALKLHLPDRAVHALLAENEDLTDEKATLKVDVDQLEAAINLLSLHVNYCESARGITVAYAKKAIRTCDEFRAAISDLASPIYLQTEEFFGCGASERWSFTVYLYSKVPCERLLPIWRSASTNFPSAAPPRVWAMGQGHVGKAFVDQSLIITGDATSAEVADFSKVPPSLARPHDENLYVSFASIPIGPILEEDGRPYGVVVGTSDRAGRFDRENSAILVQVASAIASLLIVSSLDIDNVAKVGDTGALEDIYAGSTEAS